MKVIAIKNKNILFKIVLGIFLILSFYIKAESIKDYNVVITINKNASLLINEKIKYNFDSERHGIYRDIPLRSNDKNVDFYKSHISLNYIKRNGFDEPYETEAFYEGIRYKVGSAESYVDIGENDYEFDYKIYNSVFEKDGIYQIYFNAIGQFWNVPIEKYNIVIKYANGEKITKEEMKKFVIHTGSYGSVNPNEETLENKYYSTKLENGEIIINSKQSLYIQEGVTFLLNLKTNNINPTIFDKLYTLYLANPIILFGPLGILFLLVYSIITWNIFGRDPKKKAIIPEFNIPKNTSAMYAGYINGNRDQKEILTTGILSLVSKGYLKVETSSNIMNCTINKEKENSDYSDLEEEEKELLKNIKKTNGNILSDGENLYLTAKKIFNILEDKYNILVYKKNDNFLIPYYLVFALFLVLIFGNISTEPLVIVGMMLLFFIKSTSITSNLKMKMLILSMVVVSIVIFTSAQLFIIILLAILLVMFFIYSTLIGKYTDDGIRKKEYVEGMKMYIKTAEENQIKSFNNIDELISFFKKILPFAIALGVENKVIKLLEKSIKLNNFTDNASYINSNLNINAYNNYYFRRSIFNSYNLGHEKILSRAESRGFSTGRGSFGGGGFSSGGGFSGGGSGGGGGGSW